MKRIVAAFLLCIITAANGANFSQDEIHAKEYAFKAAFLFRFIEYIDWKNNNDPGTFNIAVLGKSPIIPQLNIIAAEQRAKNKKLVVKEYKNLDDVESCYILFVPEDCPYTIEAIASKFAGKPVLIVSEKEDYVKKGAHINFNISEGKLKFEINLKAVDKAGIKISSQLLQHAVIIE